MLLAVVLTAVFAATAAEPPVPEMLKEAMRARHVAVCRTDTITWDRLTAEEFTVVVPEGKLLTKAERLASLRTEKPRPVPTPRQEQIQQYGDTVIHRFIDDNEWILEIWVREQGTWRVVAAQVNYVK